LGQIEIVALRTTTIILLVLQICACSSISKDTDIDKIASNLAGSWESTGVFINNVQLYDTLEIYPLFDSSRLVTTNVIALQTDSGKYEHYYKPSKIMFKNFIRQQGIND
jgi:hypothetical protein